MFTAYFLGNGFGGPFSKDQWLEWQVAKGADRSVYRGYGPAVVEEWGVGKMLPKDSRPQEGAVFLLQTFRGWPKGHSWLVLDFDEATGKMLTLEANTEGFGINGVGFADLGPLRSTNAKGWRDRVTTTWAKRTARYSDVYIAQLAIDHQSVLDWIEGE